jgi:hypothetical protein
MSLKGIISISGKSGLYKVVGQGKNNVIVESLEDGRKFPAFASNRISALDDISIYTYEEDVLLGEVYKKMKAHTKGKVALDHKDDVTKLRADFKAFMPDYDEERVSNTDVKKLYQWFNLLHKSDLLQFEEEEVVEEAKEEKPKAKMAAAKKKAAPKAKAAEEEE